MKIGIILETNEPEKAWNAIRFANAALNEGHEVKLFLISAGVEVESITDAKYNAQQQLRMFADSKGVIHGCGTCIKNRNLTVSDIISISTMIDCLNIVEWADKVLTF
ncbi:MAG TPA: DsrE family protein [Syntrophales bacterium]|nr:DsrE family protein [Syntrophales bacterium]